jgi:hypothetical protein
MRGEAKPGGLSLAEICLKIKSAPTTKAKVREMVAGLDRAKNVEGGSNSSTRDRYIEALLIFAHFLDGCDRGDLADWLMRLASELADLDSGAVSETLKPNPDANNRPDSSECWRARASVAVGVEILFRGGMKLADIERKIEREFPELVALTRKGYKLGASALSWRNELRQRRIKNQDAVGIWDESAPYFQSFGDPKHSCRDAEVAFRMAVTALPPVPRSTTRRPPVRSRKST